MDMSILFAVFQTGSKANGGVESITQIIRNLSGARIAVLTQKESHFCDRWRSVGEVVVQTLPYEIGDAMPWSRPFGLVRRLSSLLQSNVRTYHELHRRRVTILHANDLDALFHTGFAAMLKRIPIVLNVRDIHEDSRRYGRKWAIARWMSDRIVALSSEMAMQLRRRLPSVGRDGADVDFIHSIVDVKKMHLLDEEARARRRRELGIDEREFAIGYVANVFPKKNQLGFLRETVGEILTALPMARIHFLGDFNPEKDPYARECLEIARKMDPEGCRIAFHGFTADVAAWYPAFDVVALASQREGLARCMIEALACGTPVVSFDVCSAREILAANGCGRVVRQGDFSSLAKNLIELSGDARLRAALGSRGAEIASKFFGESAAIAAYIHIYRQLTLKRE
jgi:glycosyltransferase involved in cell wall biosynthesis